MFHTFDFLQSYIVFLSQAVVGLIDFSKTQKHVTRKSKVPLCFSLCGTGRPPLGHFRHRNLATLPPPSVYSCPQFPSVEYCVFLCCPLSHPPHSSLSTTDFEQVTDNPFCRLTNCLFRTFEKFLLIVFRPPVPPLWLTHPQTLNPPRRAP